MVKKGYKQTEIGVLPQDWTIGYLSDFGKVQSGGTPSTTIADYWGGSIAWCTPSDITSTPVKYINSTQRTITDEGLKNSAAIVMPAGSILLCTRATIGELKINSIPMATNQGFKNITIDGRGNAEFFYYLLQTKKNSMLELAIGSTFLEISKTALCKIPLQIPIRDEQNKIADALSDIDNLVVVLEKQIAKKKAIKQGAMQELLTGKRRLPGFSGKWQNFNLMKHSKIKARIGWQGLKKSEYLDSGYALLVTGTDFDDGKVQWDRCHYVTRSRYDQDRNIQIQNNDILITKDGSLGKVALARGLTKPATLNSGIFVIRPLQSIYDPVFVYHILSSFVFKNFLDKLSAGSTIIHLYQKDIDKFEFLLPPAIEEQNAIAAVLSEMDADITALEEKLAKYRQVKQGMMQQLLTGKIRLKNDVVDSVHIEQKASAKKSPVRSAHNHQFDDAVAIAAIVDAFYSDKYPLGRVKVQKLLYLLHRHQGASVSDFKKKAAGPYADTVRYKGGEPIARKNKYILSESGKQGTRYFRGENMAQALDYVERWDMQADLQWLKENFLHTSRNDLELFATVDMAMCDLDEVGISVSVESIKNLIASNKEWKAKLSKTYFSDWDTARAIKKCTELFN